RLMHDRDCLFRIIALGRFTTQHDAVGTIQYRITHVADFSTCRPGIVCHALKHLSCADGGFAGNVTLGDHHLLRNEDLSGRYLNAQITACDHDTVRLFENLVEVIDTLLVLNLGNDLNVLSSLTQHLANMFDVARLPNETGEDHVNLVL